MAALGLEYRRPHASAIASNGMRILPLSLPRDVVDGKRPASILTEAVLQRIVEEWLEGIQINWSS